MPLHPGARPWEAGRGSGAQRAGCSTQGCGSVAAAQRKAGVRVIVQLLCNGAVNDTSPN